MASSSRRSQKKTKGKGNGNGWDVDRGVRNEIRGLAALALSVLFVLALYHPSAGFVGNAMRVLMTSFLGRAAWIIPLVAALAGIGWIGKLRPGMTAPRMAGLVFAGLTTAAFYQVGTGESSTFDPETIRTGGGYVGAAITWALTAAFGPLGRGVILMSTALVALLLLINVPGSTLGRSALRVMSSVAGGLGRLLGGTEEGSEATDAGQASRPSASRQTAEPSQVAIRTYPEDAEEVASGSAGDGDSKARVRGGRQDAGADESGDLPIDSAAPTSAGAGAGADAGSPPVGAEDGAARGGMADYALPPLSLLSGGGESRTLGESARTELNRKARLLESTFRDFGIKARVLEISHGPSVTRFDLHPGPGVKVSQIVSLADDIALSMATTGVRVVAPVPGKSAVGIEVPNSEVASVSLRDIAESPEFKNAGSLLSIALGADITGRPLVVSLEDLLHVLIAGATGSGKSISIRCLIASILLRARPDQVKLLLIDPKVVEFMTYDGLPHLLAPVVTDAKKAAGCLTWAVKEMERRYHHFAERGVRDLPAHNRRAREKGEPEIPRIVIIIDELADLMMVARVDVEDAIQRLAQMARAAGIHLVVATQRPSVDVITGVIKANIPSRIAFAVSSSADSRTILDAGGAEKLLGHGDMLFSPVGRDRAIRAQGSFLSDDDLEKLLDHSRDQGDPEYREEVIEAAETESTSTEGGDESDPKLEEAVEVVMEAGEASVSMLQRRLRVGYTRAGRLMDTMENMGVVGPYQGSKPREVLMSRSRYRAERDGDAGEASHREDEEGPS